jgi:ketosteroid isomerase-like protein
MPENLEIVGRVLRRYSAQDIDGMLEDVDSGVEIDYSESDAPDASVYRGHAACRAFARGRYEDFAERSFETVELIDAPPNAVVAVGRMRGMGRGSGVAVEAYSVTLWTLRDDKIERIKLYRTRADALASLGLSEAPRRQSTGPA